MSLLDISERPSVLTAQRSHAIADLELRASEDGSVTFDGIASVVDTPYTVRDMFGEFQETMVKGSFKKTLAEKADVRLLVNHDGLPLARTKSKTLTLSANPDLRSVAKLDAANPRVQEVRSAMDRGDLDQMSIGFRVVRQEWNGDYTERFIREVELFDVSVVTYPASPTTSASLRSIEALMALDLTDATTDELRRAIDHLTTLLAPEGQHVNESLRSPEEIKREIDAYRLEIERKWRSRPLPS